MQSFGSNVTSALVAQLFKAKNYQELVILFKQKLSINSSDPLTLHMYSASLRRLGMQAECQKVLKKAIKKFPHVLQLKNSYANLLVELGELREAEKLLNGITLIDPKFVDAQVNLGRVSYKLTKFEQAKQAFQKSLLLSPLNINASIGLAEAFAALQRLDKAEYIYHDLMEKKLENFNVMHNLAVIKRKKGELDAAIILYESALAKYGPSFITIKNLAVCYASDNQIQEAKKQYKKCLEISPEDSLLHKEIVDTLWSKGDDDPFFFMREALEKSNAPITLWVTYIGLLMNTGSLPLAKYHVETLCRDHPTNPDFKLLLASILREEGRFEDGLAMSRSALSLFSTKQDSRFKNDLGYSLLSNGLGEEAADIFKLLCRKEPNNQGWWTLWSSAIRQTANMKKYSWLCDYENLVFSEFLKTENQLKVSSSFNASLKDVVIALHNNVKFPIGQSLRNGTQTYEDLFDDSNDHIQKLKSYILEQASKFVNNQKSDSKHPFLSRLNRNLQYNGSWSVCLHNNGYHKSHFHPEGWLSGVYYIDVPPEVNHEGQGWLIFGKPEIPGDEYPGDFVVKPEVGKLVLFPSYFWHGTKPFLSSKHSRISIAFDLIPAKS